MNLLELVGRTVPSAGTFSLGLELSWSVCFSFRNAFTDHGRSSNCCAKGGRRTKRVDYRRGEVAAGYRWPIKRLKVKYGVRRNTSVIFRDFLCPKVFFVFSLRLSKGTLFQNLQWCSDQESFYNHSPICRWTSPSLRILLSFAKCTCSAH